MLEVKSIFGFRDIHTLYYGPVFPIIDTPAILADFSIKRLEGLIHSAADYENYILYDWGGIVLWLHITAVISTTLGLYAAYRLLKTRTMNPAGRRWLPYLGTALVAVNFYYFEYSHFAKHWAFILPLVFVQLYSLVRIHETAGTARKYWVIHSVATVLIFGISYGGVIFLAMWIPWLVGVCRSRDVRLLKRFILYALIMAAGSALMVAWDPYPFFRSISYVGVGPVQDANLGTTQVPLASGQNSLLWYGVEIVLNDLALAAAFVILMVALWGKRIYKSFALWTLLLPALVGYLFFGLAQHHEGRYMLPTIVFLVLAFAYLLSEYVAAYRASGDMKWKPIVRTALVTLISAYAVFQIAVDIEWMVVYGRGPIEKQAIAEILQLQKTGTPILLIQGYIAGEAHDKASYEAYIELRGRQDLNLYQAIMAGDPPASLPLLDVRYAPPQQFAADPAMIKLYAHAVWQYIPIPGQINQFDYSDENVMRLWYYDELSPQWIVLK